MAKKTKVAIDTAIPGNHKMADPEISMIAAARNPAAIAAGKYGHCACASQPQRFGTSV